MEKTQPILSKIQTELAYFRWVLKGLFRQYIYPYIRYINLKICRYIELKDQKYSKIFGYIILRIKHKILYIVKNIYTLIVNTHSFLKPILLYLFFSIDYVSFLQKIVIIIYSAIKRCVFIFIIPVNFIWKYFILKPISFFLYYCILLIKTIVRFIILIV